MANMAEFIPCGDANASTELPGMRKLISALPDHYIVFGNPTRTGDELDLIIIGDWAIYVVEQKYYRGRIQRGQKSNREWDVIQNNGTRRSTPDFKNKVHYVTNRFRNLHEESMARLGRPDVRGLWIQGVLYFSHPRCDISAIRPLDDQKCWLTSDADIVQRLTEKPKDTSRAVRPITAAARSVLKATLADLFGKTFRTRDPLAVGEIFDQDMRIEAHLQGPWLPDYEGIDEVHAYRVRSKIHRCDYRIHHFFMNQLLAEEERSRLLEVVSRDYQAWLSLDKVEGVLVPTTSQLLADHYYTKTVWSDGISLLDWMQALPAPLETSEALSIAQSLAEILIKIHAKGVIHRALCPANIHRCPDGRILITNFGYARLSECPTIRHGVRWQASPYTAPELFDANESQGPGIDLYSLGVILLELLTQRTSIEAAAELSGLADLRDLISALTQADPRSRLANAREAADRLHDIHGRLHGGERPYLYMLLDIADSTPLLLDHGAHTLQTINLKLVRAACDIFGERSLGPRDTGDGFLLVEEWSPANAMLLLAAARECVSVARQLSSSDKRPVSISIGLACGSGYRARTSLGSTQFDQINAEGIHIADRLQRAARVLDPPILLSGAFADLLRDRSTIAEHGQLDLPGFNTPCRAFRAGM